MSDADAVPDGLPLPQRRWAMATIALGICMAVLDGAIANVALPTLSRELGVAASASIWVVNAYQLAITVSLLPLASLGEIVGFRRVYLSGMALFVAASLGCALSGSLETLTAWRVVQGFGAAGIMAVNGALVRFTYPRAQLGRGIGLNAVVVSTAAALGPTIAGGVLSLASWPWLFAVNVPLGLLTLLIGLRALPGNPLSGRRFDWISAGLSAATFGLLISALDGVSHGTPGGVIALQLVVGLSAGLVLVLRQASSPAPLLPVDLLRIPIFALSIGTSVCSFLAQMLAYTALPFLLQDRLHFSAAETGLMMTPWPLASAVMAALSGRLADRYPAGLLGGLGLGLFAVGLAGLAWLPAAPDLLDVSWRMALCGAGFGLFQSPNNRTILSSAPRERAGGAGGMLGTARLVGQTTGAALVALVLARSGVDGTVLALWLAAGAATAAALVSLSRLLTPGAPRD